MFRKLFFGDEVRETQLQCMHCGTLIYRQTDLDLSAVYCSDCQEQHGLIDSSVRQLKNSRPTDNTAAERSRAEAAEDALRNQDPEVRRRQQLLTRRILKIAIPIFVVLVAAAAGFSTGAGPRTRPNGSAETVIDIQSLAVKEGSSQPLVKEFQENYGTLKGRAHLVLTRGIAYRFDFIFSDGARQYILVGGEFPSRVVSWYGRVLSVSYDKCDARDKDENRNYRYSLVSRRSGVLLADEVTVDMMGIRWFTH